MKLCQDDLSINVRVVRHRCSHTSMNCVRRMVTFREKHKPMKSEMKVQEAWKKSEEDTWVKRWETANDI